MIGDRINHQRQRFLADRADGRIGRSRIQIDNVVAAVALSDYGLIVMLGVALGIVTMRFAAQIFTVMIERELLLATTAYILVLNISLELVIEEAAMLLGYHIPLCPLAQILISIGAIALALLYAHSPWLQHRLRPLLHVIGRLFAYIGDATNWLLRPFGWVFAKLFALVRGMFQSVAGMLAKSD